MNPSPHNPIRLPELLAPACSLEGFIAVLGAGADAAYISGQSFGARAYARNCTQDELLTCIDLAHLHGRRLYLTVNTLLKNKELSDSLLPFLTPLVREGLDGVLVQDFGVLSLLHRAFPDLPLHASTQMTVTGSLGSAMLKEYGVTRVVPARELSLKEISSLASESGLETEVFIHGSLCYSYSGQCLFSSVLGGRSGNRGRCAQPCRLPYQTGRQRKQGCPLSMKDLNTIGLLPDLIRAGVSSLKIEGRMKSPAYAAGVTQIYRRYLDRAGEYLARGSEGRGGSPWRPDPADEKALKDMYSRGGSCQGYFFNRHGPEMICFENTEKIRGGAEDGRRLPSPPPVGLHGILTLKENSPAMLEVRTEHEGRSICVSLEEQTVTRARENALTQESVRRQMDRMGETPFYWKDLDILLDPGVFLPVSTLNRLRRRAVSEMQETILNICRRDVSGETGAELWDLSGPALSGTAPKHQAAGISQNVRIPQDTQQTAEIRRMKKPLVYALCAGKENALTALSHPGVSGVYLPPSLLTGHSQELLSYDKPLFAALPFVLRQNDIPLAKEVVSECLSAGAQGFLVRNLEEFALLKELGLESLCITDHSLYSFNDLAAAFWKNNGAARITLPLELSGAELAHLNCPTAEQVVYGYIPLMISAQCLRDNTDRCDRSCHEAKLTDRTGARFSCRCECSPWKGKSTAGSGTCYNILCNSVPLSLLPVLDRCLALDPLAVRAEFTDESPSVTGIILDALVSGIEKGEAVADPPEMGRATRVCFRRGVL